MRVNSKLSTFEIFALTNILITMTITNTVPSILAQNTQNAFWLVPLISFIIMLPPISVISYLLHKYEAQHLIDLLEIILGKFTGKVLSFILFISYFLQISLDMISYASQIKLLYFEQSIIITIFALLIGVCILGAIRGIKVIGYTAKIFFPYFQISLFLLVILILPSIIPERIFPIFGSGLSNLIEEGLLKGSIFSESILLFMIVPVVRKPKKLYKGIMMGLLLSVIEIGFFFFLYTSFFDYDSIITTPFPFHEMTQYIKLGEFFTNIETFFLVFWLLSLFIRFVLLLYLIAWLFGAIFDIENFELLILPIGFLLMVVGLMPNNATVTEAVYRDQLFNILTPFIVGFPFILLICHFFKRKKRRSS